MGLTIRRIFLLGLLALAPTFASALSFELPENGSTVVGDLKEVQTYTGDTFVNIARRYGVGITELTEANPDYHIDHVFAANQKLLIPSQFILPNVPHQGMVINLAELRMYFYVPNSKSVLVFPVGVGRQGWGSPLGTTYIVRKKTDPTWYPTPHIIESRLKDGVTLPKMVPPGPENPLGPYAFYTAIPTILIHGSNDPSGIGRRSSSGCIRMQPEAIESFFDLVPANLQLTIINNPVQVGWLNNDLYLEVQVPLQDSAKTQSTDKVRQLIEATIASRPATIDWAVVEKTVKEQRGYPVKIGEGIGLIPNTMVPLNPMALMTSAKAVLKSAHRHNSHAKFVS